MRKLAYQIIKKLIAYKATSAEVDLLIYLCRIASESGIAQAVNYRAACAAMGSCCPQTYYNALRHLEEHGIISSSKNNYYDRDITIIDADISQGDYRRCRTQSYLNLSRTILQTTDPVWQSLTAGEKLMLLALLVRTQSNGDKLQQTGQIRMRLKKFRDAYTREFQITRDTLTVYLHHLQAYFSIGQKDGFMFVESRRMVNQMEGSTDREVYYDHLAAAGVIRDNADIDPDQIPAAAKILCQYHRYLRDQSLDVVQLFINLLRRMAVPKKQRQRASTAHKISIPYLNQQLHSYLGVDTL